MQHPARFLALLLAVSAARAANPIITEVFTADPAALVQGDTVYIYTGHDEAPEKREGYVMKEWLCFSSTDMVNWTAHGSPMSLKDFPWAVANAWAGQVIGRGGKFYWYVPVWRGNGKGFAIGIGVSDSPTGPFKDALGGPLITSDETPDPTDPQGVKVTWDDLDPSVFIDDDGQAWLFWGNTNLYYTKLKANMTERDGPIEQVKGLPKFVEAPWIHKRNGLYYLSYAYGFPERTAYATADRITGPWTFRGVIMGLAGNCNTNHQAIIEFKGRSYFIYHDGGLLKGGSFRRSVCIDYLDYNADGTIRRIVPTMEGVGPVPTPPVAASRAAIPAAAPLPETRTVAAGPFQPTWDSLEQNYSAPEWFRDAKFGIWAHWTAQCVPEQGDWYAREMYLEGSAKYKYHVEHYGHPSKFGFMELDNLWKAEKWEPEKLMDLYVRAGAKYFVALANHHDNFDAYDSKYHAWNSVNVGPKRDIVGTWAKIARARGLRFGVTNHASHAWHWFQPAYDHDREGPLAGVPYDAATLTKADGAGKWWDGLDPQDLYGGGLRLPVPASVKTLKEATDWHRKVDGNWWEKIPPLDNGYSNNWFFRAQDLVDKYQPDLFYFDDEEIPFERTGLDFVAHFYNASAARNGGKVQAVMNTKHLAPAHKAAGVEDIERGVATGILPLPWQTDTCIGVWHYKRSLFEQHQYKTTAQVVRMLADIVSKNGNLLLNIPVRGDGSIDEDEVSFLQGMAKWMDVNSEGIYGTRPWAIYGEGPSVTDKTEAGQFGGARDVRNKPYTTEDIRFTTKGGALYAFVMELPAAGGTVTVKSLATGSPLKPGKVTGVMLLGYTGPLEWSQDATGLKVKMPAAPSEHAVTLKINGVILN